MRQKADEATGSFSGSGLLELAEKGGEMKVVWLSRKRQSRAEQWPCLFVCLSSPPHFTFLFSLPFFSFTRFLLHIYLFLPTYADRLFVSHIRASAYDLLLKHISVRTEVLITPCFPIAWVFFLSSFIYLGSHTVHQHSIFFLLQFHIFFLSLIQGGFPISHFSKLIPLLPLHGANMRTAF